jgi:hypothetical protein
MATATAPPPPTHREEHPVRTCRKCGCYLRTGNLSTTCTPCGTPPWELIEDDVWAHIADIHRGHRDLAMDGVADLLERE